MGFFKDLSLELHCQICAFLNKKAISALSRTCKSLRPAMEYSLYRNVSWPDILDPNPSKPRQDALHLLLRTVLSRSELGSLAHSFRYHHVNTIEIWKHDQEIPFTRREMALARAAIVRACLSDLMSVETDTALVVWWLEALLCGSTTAVLALLLLQLPALKEVSFNFDRHGQSYRYISTSAFPFVGEASLTSVRRKSLGIDIGKETVYSAKEWKRHSKMELTFKPATFSFLFYLPVIRSISLALVEQDTFDWPREPPLTTSLQSLTFLQTGVNLNNLEKWLRAAPNLTSLTYHINMDDSSTLSYSLNCDMLKSALLSTKLTLRRLVITMKYAGPLVKSSSTSNLWKTKGQLGDLREFANLEYLKVPLLVLLRSRLTAAKASHLRSVLPPTMQHLALIHDDDLLKSGGWTPRKTTEEIYSYVLCKHRHVTKLYLRSLHLSSPNPRVFDQDILQEIEGACESGGIDFSLVVEPLVDVDYDNGY